MEGDHAEHLSAQPGISIRALGPSDSHGLGSPQDLADVKYSLDGVARRLARNTVLGTFDGEEPQAAEVVDRVRAPHTCCC